MTEGIARRDQDNRERAQATLNNIESITELLQATLGEEREGRMGMTGRQQREVRNEPQPRRPGEDRTGSKISIEHEGEEGGGYRTGREEGRQKANT